jgi:hypothetical protein
LRETICLSFNLRTAKNNSFPGRYAVFDTLAWFFKSETVIGWASVVAELIVAAVIYFELEQGRRQHFLERATAEHADHDRRQIYKEFVAATGCPTLEERSKVFVGRMQNAPTEPENGTPKQNGKVSLKTSCDRQIALFNDLGITVGAWYSQSETLVEIFPHAAIFIWIILHPYIIQRRKDTGKWLAKPLLEFTLKCVTFVLKENGERGLHLRQANGQDGLTISREDLLKVERQLSAELDRPVLVRQ